MFTKYHGFKYGMQFTEAINVKVAGQMRAKLRVVINGLEINGMDRTEAKNRVWTEVAVALGATAEMGCFDWHTGLSDADRSSITAAIQPILGKVANLEQVVKAAMGVDEDEDEDEDGSDGDGSEDEADGSESDTSEPAEQFDFDKFSDKNAIEE